MKALCLIPALATLIFFSCKKENPVSNMPPSILGKWTFVSDTVTNQFILSTTKRVFTVQPTDYIDFRSDGKVYISEKSANWVDTLNYTLVSDTSVVKTYRMTRDSAEYTYGLTWSIKNLTSNTMFVDAHTVVYAPGGTVTDERMHFKK